MFSSLTCTFGGNYKAMSFSTSITARDRKITIIVGTMQSVKVTELTTFVRLSTYRLKAKLMEKLITILTIQQSSFAFLLVEVLIILTHRSTQGGRDSYTCTLIPKLNRKHNQKFWEVKLKILGRKLSVYIR